MKRAPKLFAAALSLALAGQTLATELKSWPAPAAKQLEAMIAANANKGNYAVFDMDNTSYRFDLEESLLPWRKDSVRSVEGRCGQHQQRYHQRFDNG